MGQPLSRPGDRWRGVPSASSQLSRGVFTAASWLASLVAVCGDCVDDGICVLRNSYHYKTLDGTARNETSVGCQTAYLAMPAHWELANYNTDAPAVAGDYEWGTYAIVHGPVASGEWTGTKVSSRRRYNSDWTIWTSSNEAGETTYKPRYCDARLLIRQVAEVNCPKGRGLPLKRVGLEAKCSECAAGYNSHGGLNAPCLPLMAYAAGQLTNSSPPASFRAQSDDFGIIRLSLSAGALPEALYEGLQLQYTLDIKPNESSLDLEKISACQQKYWSSTMADDKVAFKIVLRYPDLDKDCELGFAMVQDKIKREGIVGVALIVKDAAGSFKGTVMTWHYPVDVNFATSVTAIHGNPIQAPGSQMLHNITIFPADWADTDLSLYHTNAFGSEKADPIYEVGERAFIEVALNDNPGLVLTPVLAWISESRDPFDVMLHNLTDSIVLLDSDNAGNSQVKFSVVLVACASCYLHVLAEISSRRLAHADDDANGGKRQLESSSVHHTLLTMPITVEEPAGSEEDNIVILLVSIVGGGVGAVLLIACGTCFYLKQRSRAFKGPAPPASAAAPAPATRDTLVPYRREAPAEPDNSMMESPRPQIRKASPEIKTALDRLFAAATHVGEGGRDCLPGPWRTLRCVAAWELEITQLLPGYAGRRRQIHLQLNDVCREKFGGTGIPAVKTAVDEFREGMGLRTDLNETFLFHGTKKDLVLDIVYTSVSSRLSSGLFGYGAYLAEDLGKTDQYVSPLKKDDTDKDSERLRSELFTSCDVSLPDDKEIFFVVVVKVPLGFPVYTKDSTTAMADPPTTTFLDAGKPVFATDEKRELVTVPDMTPPTRYHSLIAEKGGRLQKFREFIIYDSQGVLPSYIAAYVREVP